MNSPSLSQSENQENNACDAWCAICGNASDEAREQVEILNGIVAGACVCYDCASKVANAYWRMLSPLGQSVLPAPRTKAVIPNALRKAVFERDGYRCKHCNSHIDLCADHIHPESKGGETVLENLQTLCRSCNSKKGVR